MNKDGKTEDNRPLKLSLENCLENAEKVQKCLQAGLRNCWERLTYLLGN